MSFKSLYKKAVSWHKYLGLGLSIVLIWMSLSGILLNHPDLIAKYSISQHFFTDDYLPKNWNRGGIQDAVFIGSDSVIVGGKQGIWMSTDKGKSFHSIMKNGFTKAIYYQKTNDLYYDSLHHEVYAATFGGVYRLDLKSLKWTFLPTNSDYQEQFVKILSIKQQLFAFSQSQVYKLQDDQLIPFSIFKKERKYVDLIQFTFALHSGWLWGMSGRLVYDLLSLVLLFLSASSLYITFFKKKKVKYSWSKKLKKFIITYHTKIGVWTFIFLFVIGGTGMFMRPPLIVALFNGKVPAQFIPDSFLQNQWYHTIRNAMYDVDSDRLILDTTEGVYGGKSDGSEAFKLLDWKVNIFVMGATVFESLGNHQYLVGSFYGLYNYNELTQNAIDVITHERVPFYNTISKPGDFMVVGAFDKNTEEKYISTFGQGLLSLTKPNENTFFDYPIEIRTDYRLPLWNYMFELHNGRLFQFIFDKYSILLIPLMGLFFQILLFTGLYEYLYRKRRKIKQFFKRK